MKSTTFALFLGTVYLSVGLLGLNPAMLMPPPADAPPIHFTVLYGYLLGLFPVNILHSAVHLAVGCWGLVAWRSMVSSKIYARSLAIFYGVLAVIGVIPGLNTFFGTLPIHGHDVWLHGGTAALAAYFGWNPEVSLEHRDGPATSDRREQSLAVEPERRVGHADRRLPNRSEV